MKHIYYKNDFAVEITLLNASGEVVAPPEWQWHIEFTDGRRKYICSVDKGNANVVGNTIMCYLDNHKFCCGEVGYKFVQAIPDLNYLDGFQNLITPKALQIELWDQESDGDVNIQSSVVPAYVVYDAYMTAKANGYEGTAEEFYDALNHIVGINKNEAERVEAEANRVTAEQQRVENFVAMESALTTATTKANTATTKAEEATKRADNSATAASQASVQATIAANGANAAAAQATQAMEKTNTATELANTATANANNSAVNAGNAATEANEATKSANDATEKAKTATIAAEKSAERANTAADNADVATSNATTATKRANDISADLEAKREADYWRGAKGENGDDGVSPTVKTSKTGKVTTIEITDAQGTHTATVNDGESVEVVQSTGTSTTAVMSQKAVSDALSNAKMNLLYELGFSDLRHFYASRVDASTATYYVDDGIPEWVRTCPMINNRYALNIDRFFNDNNISIERKKYTKQIKSTYVWIEIIDNNSFVAYENYTNTQITKIEDASTVGEFAFCEIAKGFKLDITGFSTVVFEIYKCVKNVLSSMFGLNGQTYSDLSVYRERGDKYYSPLYPVNCIRGYISINSTAVSSYSNIINIKRGNGNLEIEQAKINSSALEIASDVNAIYENSVPLINPIVSDIQDDEKLYLSPYVYIYSSPLPYIPHTTIKVYGKK